VFGTLSNVFDPDILNLSAIAIRQVGGGQSFLGTEAENKNFLKFVMLLTFMWRSSKCYVLRL
jgi:hypothetical protein